jgi:hypothetical protein
VISAALTAIACCLLPVSCSFPRHPPSLLAITDPSPPRTSARVPQRLAAALESPVDLPAAAAFVLSLSPADRARLARAARELSGPSSLRLRYLLWRTSSSPGTPPRGRAVLLDPASPPGGPRAGAIVVNAADGLPQLDARLVASLVSELTSRHGRGLARVALVLDAGARPLISTLAAATGSKGAACLAELGRRGFVQDGADGLSPVDPLPDLCRAAIDGARGEDRGALAESMLGDGSLACDVHAAIAVLAAGGRADDARAIAERYAKRLLGSLDVKRLGELAAMLAGCTPGSTFLYGLLESTGRHADLADLADADRREQRGDARAVATLWAARAAWRRGQNLEAERLLASLRSPPEIVRFDLALLASLLAQESGDWARAETALDRATSLAERARSPHDLARCLHRRGTLASRRGQAERASGAYLAALDCLRSAPDHDRRLEGILVSNSATMRLWSGRFDDAERLYREAIVIRSEAGTEREAVATLVAAARVTRARVGASPAPAAQGLATRAEALGDPRLATEAWLDAAEAAEHAGEHAAALAALDRARACEARMTGEDRILAGLADAVSAKVLAWETGAMRAASTLDRVADELSTVGAPFYAARARRIAAGVLSTLDPDGALERLVAAHRVADDAGLVLGEEPAFVRLYARAALSDDPRARAIGVEGLMRIPTSEVHRVLGAARATELFAKLSSLRATGPSGDRVELVTSSGPRTVSSEEAVALRRGRAGALVVDRERDALIAPDGTITSLLRRPRLSTLLFTLAAGRGEPVGAVELARSVWRARDSRPVRDALKVAVGRARRLVRPHGVDIVPARLDGSLAYRWRGTLEVVLLGAPPASRA